ncbi:uncharacterized protein B0H64DRAFT_389855 [Chaetomium fimeti]|uniref:CMP/dCMP-type deaminase domain-containing protein n=1 Tax=Chaetomium fimeti TaxID=1854472 RepID=A0AAE0HJA3_9PEZI|nr:hypothetical protein B0H64DRAFT_389855 [Chaetomium fimeti]
MTSPQTPHLDPELFNLCVGALTHIPATDDNHTVAAAVRSHAGQTFVALNVYHFTGGPCAELAVLGTAAAGGVLAPDIATIVAVCRRQGEKGEDVYRVINPCGRCSQTMLDYNPEIGVVVLDEKGREVRARVGGLMVFPSVWEDGNTGREEKRKAALEEEGKGEGA